MELTRKWWKSRCLSRGGRDDEDRFFLPTIDDFQPLDSQEQEEMVRSFERAHEQDNHLWRGVFAVFLLGYVVFLIYSIFQQAWNPWELRYHAYFMEDVPSWMLISADLVAILACLLAVKGMLDGSIFHQRLIWHSFYVGLVLAVFWSYYMLRLPRFRWDVLWLPFGPLSAATICLYVDNILRSSREEIRTLQDYMYEYKRR
ncbi:uncharacterized protein LOC110115928 isoform X1 [Dendrobium catenatum]|uniref:uncharacterized protein LOC110115928 isoform X1 n=1 Tax=Dendrobium catenatum TaxID=906689 RepID=UPI0009F35943|nr:uncharacterized protein LOC110115928 isoform X1 [Dendrobium catenatum]